MGSNGKMLSDWRSKRIRSELLGTKKKLTLLIDFVDVEKKIFQNGEKRKRHDWIDKNSKPNYQEFSYSRKGEKKVRKKLSQLLARPGLKVGSCLPSWNSIANA